jgi:hypothetical protein
LRFEDKNKISENAVSTIEWDSPRTKWTLKQLMERRFQAVIPGVGPQSWDKVFDEEKTMSGRQKKYQHMLDRTFRRPRDMIKFCNEVLVSYRTRSSDNSKFQNEDVAAARENFSRYFLHEIEDEVPKHLPDYERYLDLLRAIGVASFDRDLAEEAFHKRSRAATARDPSVAQGSVSDYDGAVTAPAAVVTGAGCSAVTRSSGGT